MDLQRQRVDSLLPGVQVGTAAAAPAASALISILFIMVIIVVVIMRLPHGDTLPAV